jgi:hypothetical protein
VDQHPTSHFENGEGMTAPYEPFDDETERRRMAATRDYTTPAILTLVLYFVMWLPGLIANIIYFMQASEDEKLAGHPPRGKGCLLALLIVWVAGPLLLTALACALFALFGTIATITTDSYRLSLSPP